MSRVKKAVVTVVAAILFYISYTSNVALYYLIDRFEPASASIREEEMTLILVVLVAIIIAGVWSIKSDNQN